MSNKINHWCIICGKGYHACDSCDSVKSFMPWRILADTAEHYKIYMVIKQYNSKMITKNEAKTMLSNIDLEGMDSFKDGVKSILDEILKEDTPSRKPNKKRVAEEIAEESVTEIDTE